MKRACVCCGVGGAAAALVLSVVAVCHGYHPVSAPDPQPPLPRNVALSAASIDDLLNRLDSLAAQKAALDKEEKETVAVLKAKLEQQEERLRKLGVRAEEGEAAHPESPAAACEPVTSYRWNSYYEPVTTYSTRRDYDPATGSYKEVSTPVTRYVLRRVATPVTTYRPVPVQAPNPPTVPPVPAPPAGSPESRNPGPPC